MKKIIGYTIIGLLIAAAWIGGCSRGNYKRGVEDGIKIEHLKAAKVWDSIDKVQLNEKLSGYEKTNISLQSDLKRLEQRNTLISALYEKKVRTLQTLSKLELDSVYRLYAKDSTQAVERFYDLDECNEILALKNQMIEVGRTIAQQDQKIINDLKSYIDKESLAKIELRNENEQLTAELLNTKDKLRRRTMQRNVTWIGLITVGAALIILK
jgi:hypothetical protein